MRLSRVRLIPRAFFGLWLLPAAGLSQFAPAPTGPVAIGQYPVGVAVGDFNRDTIPDLAAINQIDGTVSILFGDGKGGFKPNPNGPFPVGKYPSAITAADFNGDGKADLAVTNAGSNDLTILLGDGGGGFSISTVRPGLASPSFVVSADLNGDLQPDLVVTNLDSDSVTVLLGDGKGGFNPMPANISVGKNPSCVAIKDFNGDNYLDLAVANQTSGTLSILLGDGKGGFAATPTSPISLGTPQAVLNPSFVAAGDFNQDGFADLAVAILNNKIVILLQGNGMGGFTAFGGSPLAVGTEPIALAVADLNGDGNPDLAVANYRSNNVSIFYGSAAGTFTAAAGSPYAAGTLPRSAAVADLNGDGKPDLAIADFNDGAIAVLLNIFSSNPAMGSAASGMTSASPGSLVSIYGTGLAANAVTASSPGDWPKLLGGTSVTLTDSSGVKTPLLLYYASPTQIDGFIPASVTTGPATYAVSSAAGSLQSGSIVLNAVAPGLFTANGTGKGVAAGEFFSNVLGTGFRYVFCCKAPDPCMPVGLDVTTGNPALVLYGSGIRNRAKLSDVTVSIGGQSFPAFYAGATAGSFGLDQVNVALPPTLVHAGTVFVTVSVAGSMSNPVTLLIQ